MNWLWYLIEANIYLMVFFGFYLVVLRRETFYGLNRFYLLFISLAAFVLPCLQLSGLRPAPVTASVPMQYVVDTMPSPITYVQATPQFWTTSSICIALYLVVVLYFFIRLCLRLYKIFRLAKQVKHINGVRVVEITGKNTSFSFLNYLFIDPSLSGIATIIRHEKIHIRQYHSVDVLFFELLQIINWFNPLIILLKKEIKAIHEFIADEETLDKDIDAESYSMFLINHSYDATYQNLGSQMFNGPLLKERILRLYQQRSRKAAKWKYVITMPLLVLMVCISSVAFTKTYGIVDLMPQTETTAVTSHFSTLSPKIHPENIPAPANQDQDQPKHNIAKNQLAGKKPVITDQSENINVHPKQDPLFSIDARTDTVKFRTMPGKMPLADYKGIYVVGDKIYSRQEIQTALQPTGKMDVIFANRPIIGIYTENDENAVKRWGERARNGVVFILPREDFVIPQKDTTASSAYK